MKNFSFWPSFEFKKISTDVVIPGIDLFQNDDFNFDEFKKYVDIELRMHTIQNYNSKYIAIKFRKCKLEDFESRGLKISDTQKDHLLKRICPDLPPLNS